jgi:TonB family protein
MLFGLLLVLVAAPGQAAPPPSCVGGLSPAAAQSCLGEQEVRLAEAAKADEGRRRRHLETAAQHFRRAADLAGGEDKVKALSALAGVYGDSSLDEPGPREGVLRELVALTPSDTRFAFELAAHQESQTAFDDAEQTLLLTRQQHPWELDTFRKLAQFYARRVSALQPPAREQNAGNQSTTGGMDKDGVLQIGGAFKPPPRLDVPQFPEEAQAAGIEGVVLVEVLISPEGTVSETKVVRSVPLLDEPAMKAVREWRFQPTLVNGQAVPVRMVVNVRFTLSR